MAGCSRQEQAMPQDRSITGYPKPGATGVKGTLIFPLEGKEEVYQVNVGAYAYKLSTYSFYLPDLITVSVSDDR